MSAPKNGTRLTVVISIVIGLITALGTVGSIIYAFGGYSGKIDKGEIVLIEHSQRIEELERKSAIFSTQIVENKDSIDKQFVTENMMRKEIQTNAEGKLNRDDFFRIQSDTDKRFTRIQTETSRRFASMEAQLLYLQRHQIDLDLHTEVHSQ